MYEAYSVCIIFVFLNMSFEFLVISKNSAIIDILRVLPKRLGRVIKVTVVFLSRKSLIIKLLSTL